VLASLLLLVLVVLIIGVAWLKSSAGRDLVRGKVLAAANDAIAGSLELGDVDWQDGHLVLTDLKLLTPEGTLVVSIARVELDVDLPAAARRQVHLSRVRVVEPVLSLVKDERGLNLSRAIASRTPSAASSPSAPLKVEVADLNLEAGRVSFTDGTRTVDLTALSATADAEVVTEPLTVASRLRLTGTAVAPMAGPVTFSLSTVSPTPGTLEATTDLRLADEQVKGRLTWPSLSTEFERVHLTPALLEALGVSGVRQAITISGAASPQNADLRAEAGLARASVKAQWNTTIPSASSVEVSVKDIDLSEWLDGGKSSRLEVSVIGALPNATVEGATGQLDATASWKTPDGQALADATARVTAQDGALMIQALNAKVPGASVSLAGKASRTELGLAGTLVAKDLSTLHDTLVEFTGSAVPALSGNGTLAVQLTGPTRGPKLVVQGTLTGVRVASVSAQALQLDATVPDVTRPLDADGVLTVTGLRVADQTVESLRAEVATHGRALDVSVKTRGLGDLSLTLGGRLDDDNDGLALQSFTLDTSADRWSLTEPAHLFWGGAIVVTPLVMTAGRQRLSLEGALNGRSVTATARVDDLDLKRLPKLLVSPTLGVSGLLSLEATVSGALPRPDATVVLQLRDGSVKGVTQVHVVVDGRFERGRVVGELDVGTSLGALKGRVDVPVQAVIDEGPDALAIDAEVSDVDLEVIQQWLGETWPVVGVLSATLSAKGPANDPAITVKVDAPTLTVTPTGPLLKSVTFQPAAVSLETSSQGTLSVSASSSALGAIVLTSLDTPLTLATLRQRPPTVDELRAMAVTFKGSVAGLKLEALKPLGVPFVDEVSGLATARASLTGSVDDPRGLVSLELVDVTAPPLTGVSGTLELAATEALTRLHGGARWKDGATDKPLFDLDAFIDAPVRALERPDQLGAEHVTAHLSVAPMPLSRLLPKREDEAQPTGAVSLELDVKGTLDDPKLTIDGAVQNLSFGKVPLGFGRFVSRTQGNAQRVTLTLKASGDSTLSGAGTVGVDLSVGALRKGLTFATVPLDLAFTAKAFELGFLSGVTPTVRTVGGALSTQNLTVTGTVGAPVVTGDIEWKNGRLALAGNGDYRDIDLALKVTNDTFVLSTLSVRAGGGGVVLGPTVAERQASGAWKFSSSGTATRFPVVNGDQLKAIVTLNSELEGELSDTSVDVSRLSLPSVVVELPEVRRKDVQDLERPTDVVLIRGGKVIAGKLRKDQGLATADQKSASRTVRVLVVAPRNLWLKSSDVNLEVGLTDGFRVEYAEALNLFGEAQVLGGRIDVIGREFKLSRGVPGAAVRSDSTVRFAGPAAQPYVNVTAQHTNEREKVKVTASVVGRGTDVALKVSSDPPMNESDIYTLLATGRRDLRRSSGASVTPEQAVSVLGSLAANQLKGLISKKLPLDVLSVDTGSEGLQSTRVEVGKYLTDSIYLGYTFQPGANASRGENTHGGRLELQVSKDVCLEASAGNAAFGADVVWSRDF